MRYRHFLLFLFPILVGSIGLAVNYTDGFRKFRNNVQGRTIPDVIVKSGKTGKELRLIEYRLLSGIELEGFDKNLAPQDMPSSKNLKTTAQQSGLPTLSIVIDPDDLLSRNTGLMANYTKRGRSWERPAYASYFENGELRFATGAGLRVHGGRSRTALHKSFRLYFRELYGSSQIPSGVLFRGEGDPIRSIVVHNDLRFKKDDEGGAEWHFINPLAYGLAREIGCFTPNTQPVQFYLNGVYQGPYVLTELISGDFLKAHFGHDDFDLLRTKQDQPGESLVRMGDRQSYDELNNWLNTVPAPLKMSEVEEKVDLVNMTNWKISILYSGVTDAFQGAALLDKKDPNARWFWVNWDMDHAFMDVFDQVAHPWEIDTFSGRGGVLTHSGFPTRSGELKSKRTRSVIFDRLRRESPEYRIFFLKRITEVLNHIFTPERVRQRLMRLENTAITYGISDRAFLESIKEYINERPSVLRRQLNTYFDAGNSYRLSISSGMPIDIRVDGYQVGHEYVGWYFTDTPARIEISESDQQSVGVWVVDGEQIPMHELNLELRLISDTHVEILPSLESVH